MSIATSPSDDGFDRFDLWTELESLSGDQRIAFLVELLNEQNQLTQTDLKIVLKFAISEMYMLVNSPDTADRLATVWYLVWFRQQQLVDEGRIARLRRLLTKLMQRAIPAPEARIALCDLKNVVFDEWSVDDRGGAQGE